MINTSFANAVAMTTGLNWDNLIHVFSPYLIAAACGYLLAQLIKVILAATKYREFRWRELFKSGSMPSSHSATVIALATTIGLKDGFGSPLFALAAIFVAVVIYDATHVRRAVGEQGEVLRKLIERDHKQEGAISDIARETGAGDDKTRAKLPKPYFAKGHKPIEVLAGGILGLIIGIAIYLIY